MRNRYLIAYDIADDRRLRKVAKKLEDLGSRMQYSVFLVLLSNMERIQVERDLLDLVVLKEDRVMIVNLGPHTNEPFENIAFLGSNLPFTRPTGPQVF